VRFTLDGLARHLYIWSDQKEGEPSVSYLWYSAEERRFNGPEPLRSAQPRSHRTVPMRRGQLRHSRVSLPFRRRGRAIGFDLVWPTHNRCFCFPTGDDP
jgi:hypothetical protein